MEVKGVETSLDGQINFLAGEVRKGKQEPLHLQQYYLQLRPLTDYDSARLLTMIKIKKGASKTNNGNNKNNMSNHILPTSSNLLGLCFVILNFIKLSKIADETIIDEVSAVSIVFFFISSLLSYVSIRSKSASESYEKTAEIIFLVGLLLLAGVSVAVVLETMR